MCKEISCIQFATRYMRHLDVCMKGTTLPLGGKSGKVHVCECTCGLDKFLQNLRDFNLIEDHHLPG